MVRLYLIGLSILLIAILANAIALKFHISTWYDFLSTISSKGLTVFKELSILDYLWLFLVYPLILGIGYWLGDKMYSLF